MIRALFSDFAQFGCSPLTWTFLLFAIGILLWKRCRVSRWLCVAGLALLLIFSSPAVAWLLMRSLEGQYPDRSIAAVPQAQAIVVLGGAVHQPNGVHRNTGLIDPSDRLLEALRLYRAGKAPLIVCSGGTHLQTPEAQTMSALLEEWGVPPEAILREDRSFNTRENAVFSYSLLKPKGIRQILLVTSALHMPRAAAAFRKAGFEVTPAAADFRTGWAPRAAPGGFMPNTGDLVSSEKSLKEWVGLLGYRVAGWA